MAGTIGIKQANGNFYSIMEENSAVKKRLVLTTVHNNQKSVQIDLYKSEKKTMADAMYIGSIVVENIGNKPKGEPSIEMVLSSTKDGSISANAVDLANPENRHQLSISLKSLEEDKNDYPDFDLETSRKINTEPDRRTGRKFPWLAIIITGVVLALICLGLWFFLFRNKNATSQTSQQPAARQKPPAVAVRTQESTPASPAPQSFTASAPDSPETQQGTAAQTPAAQAPPAAGSASQKPPVVVETPPERQTQAPPRNRGPAPVYSYNVPQTIPSEGIVYKIRWGDTLWNISEAFYRNPRLYTFIVRSNNIRNPNLIVSGTEITILPRN